MMKRLEVRIRRRIRKWLGVREIPPATATEIASLRMELQMSMRALQQAMAILDVSAAVNVGPQNESWAVICISGVTHRVRFMAFDDPRMAHEFSHLMQKLIYRFTVDGGPRIPLDYPMYQNFTQPLTLMKDFKID